MDGADILHAVVVGKQGGNIAETAAVSGIDHEQQYKHQYHNKCILSHICNTLCKDHKSCGNNGKNKDDFINGVSVLKSICPCGETKTSSCIENCGYGGENTHNPYKSDTLDDHFFLWDQSKTTGNV